MVGRYLKFTLCFVILPLLFVATIGIKHAGHLRDNDFWFHAAYGRYFIEHQTLIPDHTIFSWTPSDNRTIYCAWIPETILYLLYEAGGLNALFVLRYICIIVFIILAYQIINIKDARYIPIVLLIYLCGILMSDYGISRSKPELISFLLMACMIWAWFKVKTDTDEYLPYLYLFPILILIWVNSHGGFIFGILVLCLIILGEAMNFVLTSPRKQIDHNFIKHFLAATILSALAIFITPYGWNYPLQIINQLLLDPQEFREHMKTILEYQSIFNPAQRGTHFIGYLIISSAILSGLFLQYIKNHKLDWTIVLLNVFFIFLYIKYIRATYYWAIVFVFSALYFLRECSAKEIFGNKYADRVIQISVVFIFLLISFRSQFDAICSSQFGFRINFKSPVEEASFIKERYPYAQMGNDYDCGSYLLWILGPQKKVFIDSRYFPYKEWYSDYVYFTNAQDNLFKDKFFNKYPCDVWCATYDYPPIDYFVTSPNWRLSYYGPSACIFVSSGLHIHDTTHSISESIYEIDNIHQALKIACFALSIGDIDVAARLALRMKPLLVSHKQTEIYVETIIAVGNAYVHNGRYIEAVDIYSHAIRLLPSNPYLYFEMGNALARNNQIDEAIRSYQKTIIEKPDFQNAVVKLRQTLSFKKQLNDSIRKIQALTETAPDNPILYTELGNLYKQLGEYDKAVIQYQKSLSIKGDFIPAMNGLLYVYSEEQNLTNVLDLLESMKHIRPDDPNIYYNMACAYAKLNMINESISWLKVAIDKGFDDWELVRKDNDLRKIRNTSYVKKLMKEH